MSPKNMFRYPLFLPGEAQITCNKQYQQENVCYIFISAKQQKWLQIKLVIWKKILRTKLKLQRIIGTVR